MQKCDIKTNVSLALVYAKDKLLSNRRIKQENRTVGKITTGPFVEVY